MPQLYMAIVRRSAWLCECGCGAKVPPGEVDHFFGRAKAVEELATCWLLTPRCHFEKTRNYPRAAAWMTKFIRHCVKHDYQESATRARGKLAALVAKGFVKLSDVEEVLRAT